MAYTQTPGVKKDNKLPAHLNNGSTDATTPAGNDKGYAEASSPLPNTVNKGGYEKKLIQSDMNTSVYDGGGKTISTARTGTKAAEDIVKEYKRQKDYTESSRARNSEFLKSRQTTGQAVK